MMRISILTFIFLVTFPMFSHAQAAPLTPEQKQELLKIARETIVSYLTTGEIPTVTPSDPRLSEPEGAFVTLRKNKQLRGCIGHVVTDDPLYKTVQTVAVAATEDSRFRANPVKASEIDQLHIEISVLSKPWRIKSVDEIQTGVHGVIVSRGSRQGLFLPQVATEWGWNREELLTQLCAHKAGLPPDAWKDPATEIQIFTADVFEEEGR
jgi:AmmeMemoRadiSam system protein A